MNENKKAVTDSGTAPSEMPYEPFWDDPNYGQKQTAAAEVPQKWKHHEYGMDVRNLTRGQLNESYAELKAHAEGLAEALRKLVWIGRFTHLTCVDEARAALAQWEKGQ